MKQILLLLLLLSVCCVQSSFVCTSDSPKGHTFVLHSTDCELDPTCAPWYSPNNASTWMSCGFHEDRPPGLPYVGALRNDIDPSNGGEPRYWCKDWETFPVSDLCSRQVISSLIDRFASMPYSLVKGWFYYLITETVPYVPPTCPPSADGDTKRDAICWQFTLEYVNALNTRRNANDPVCKNITTPDLNLWMCNKTSYGSGDGCHCQCGLWDPDCDNQSTQNVAGNVFLPGLNGTMIPCNGLCFPPGTCMNPNPCTPDASSWWLRVLPSYWPSWLTNIAFAVLVVVIVILTIFLCCRCCKSKKVPKSDYQSV